MRERTAGEHVSRERKHLGEDLVENELLLIRRRRLELRHDNFRAQLVSAELDNVANEVLHVSIRSASSPRKATTKEDRRTMSS